MCSTRRSAEAAASPLRWRWAQLLRRVFKMDVESCPKCESPLKLVAMITETVALTRLLTHLGMPTTPPRVDPARLPPQIGWDFDFKSVYLWGQDTPLIYFD